MDVRTFAAGGVTHALKHEWKSNHGRIFRHRVEAECGVTVEDALAIRANDVTCGRCLGQQRQPHNVVATGVWPGDTLDAEGDLVVVGVSVVTNDDEDAHNVVTINVRTRSTDKLRPYRRALDAQLWVWR